MLVPSPFRPLPLGRSIAILLVAAAPFCVHSTRGAAYIWDGNLGVAGAQDGSGIWETTANNWVDAGANVPWTNANDATFGAGIDGTYTVTVALTPTATKLVFNNSGYTLTAT